MGLEEDRRYCCAAKDVVHVTRDADLLPRRIDGVHPDQRLEVPYAVPQGAFPVNLGANLSCVRLGSHEVIVDRW
jgi:hypothetical protein